MKYLSAVLFSLMFFVVSTISSSFAQLDWTKDPNNPVLSGGASGTWNRCVYWPSVLYNPDSARYEMWYSGSAGSPLRPMNFGLATSPDGVNWTHHGSAVLKPDAGTWDESSVEGSWVIREGGGNYKMWYSGSNSVIDKWSIGYATSSDGINWTKHPGNPVMTQGPAAWEAGGIVVGSVLYNEYSTRYEMWYSGYTLASIGNIGHATSPDGIIWTKDTLPVLTNGSPGTWDEDSDDLPRVLYLDNTYHMWFVGIPESYNAPWQIGWATSSDGIHWNKYNDPSTTSQFYSESDPVLQPDNGQWDGGVLQAGTVMREGDTDRLHMWYTGILNNLGRIGHATAPFTMPSTIRVPEDLLTIQAAIDSSENGDLVLVADGTYQENINFKSKAITVASHFYIDGDTSHISNTVIDGSNPSNPDSGSVVYFISGEDTNSVLCGFTITGGTGTLIGNGTKHGGGLYVLNSTAYIRNNYIEFNSINHNTDAFGGGIYAGFHNNQDLIIENNMIRNNSIISTNVTNYCLGGGVYSWADGTETVRISNNSITNNSISAPVAYGGGIDPANDGNANYVITNNLIKGNSINATSGASGGVDIYNHFLVLHNNVIVNNSAPGGGGMQIEFTTAEARATGMRGTGATKSEESADLQTEITGLLYLSNNTIVGNSATASGGGIGVIGPIIPIAMNFIVWGNTAPSDPQISGFIDIRYSDVQDTLWPGEGNINADPQFVAGDSLFHLTPDPSNPCVNTGADSIEINQQWYYCPPYDYEGDERPYLGQQADIGADETQVSLVGIESKPTAGMPQSYALEQNYPNPFNPETTIEFSIPQSEFVTLKIYNHLGQEVATLVSEKLAPGKYTYKWDATGFASAIYVYTLETSKGFKKSNKLLLVK